MLGYRFKFWKQTFVSSWKNFPWRPVPCPHVFHITWNGSLCFENFWLCIQFHKCNLIQEIENYCDLEDLFPQRDGLFIALTRLPAASCMSLHLRPFSWGGMCVCMHAAHIHVNVCGWTCGGWVCMYVCVRAEAQGWTGSLPLLFSTLFIESVSLRESRVTTGLV